ncbi:MAG TPA: caspase family protein [Gaiellaceae bacterium]|nr:caspase family protein [Gaiellaceae bacterium]
MPKRRDGRDLNDLHYAVVVGINRYPGVRDLKYARRDAHGFKKWLLSSDGGRLPTPNVRSIVARPRDESAFRTARQAWPTVRWVNDALEDINLAVTKHVQKDPRCFERTRLYLYASGHGIAPANGSGAVLMADADLQRDALGYNIELSLYQRWYVDCGLFREIVIFADCCRDRFFTAPGMGPPWAACPNPYGPTRFALGFATTFATSAFEPRDVTNLDAARGYYTKALLDGLGGGAADPAGQIDSTNLATYVRLSVQALTETKRFGQRPTMVADPGDPVIFRPPGGPAPARPRRNAVITFPKGYKGRVTLRRGQERTGKSWAARNGSWQLPLEEGLYAVVSQRSADAGLFQNDGLFRVLAKDVDVQL